jgi:CheY-specific phosphatase CheX
MKAESLSRIDAFLAASALEAFASHGLALEEAEYRGEGIEEPFASTIGFTCGANRGVLVLTASRVLALGSLPANLRLGEVEARMVADWTGELSNQMLGRLKNRFHGAGVEISLSTPTVFAGREMRHFAIPSSVYRSLLFTGGGGLLLIEFQADFGEDFYLGEGGDEGGAGAAEGEVLFF